VRYLLDTNVLSELRCGSPVDGADARWSATWTKSSLCSKSLPTMTVRPSGTRPPAPPLEALGWSTSFADGQIAAVAAVNDLVVVTRNVGH